MNYIAKQLQINAKEIHIYTEREQTKHEHLEEIRREYGFRNFTIHEYRVVSQVLLQYALENGNALYLIQIAIKELKKRKIILLAMTTIERMIWEVRRRAEVKIFRLLNSSLAMEYIQKLNCFYFRWKTVPKHIWHGCEKYQALIPPILFSK